MRSDTNSFQNLDSVYQALTQNINQAKSSGNNIAFTKSNIRLGEYYAVSGLYIEAISQYKTALESIDKSSISPMLVDLKNDIGKVYMEMNNYKAAIIFFEEALENATKINYPKGKAIAQGSIGTMFEKQGKYVQALDYQKESLAIFEFLNDSLGIAMINENIGSIYEDLANYPLAYSYFKNSYQLLLGSHSRAEAHVLNNIGDVHRKSGDYTKALMYTQQSLDLSLAMQDNHLIESAYKDLSKTYALKGNYQKAFQNRLESDMYREKALKHQNLNQINALQTAYQAEKRETQIQLLQHQNEVSKANVTLLLVISVSAVIVFVVVFIYYNKKRKHKQKILDYKQRTLRAELEKKEIEEKNLQRDIQLKTTALSRYSLHLSQKNKILSDLSQTLKQVSKRKNIDINTKINEITKEIDFNLKQENEWEEFKVFFKEIHPDFVKKLSGISQDKLSPSELKLGILLRLNMSSKEIASILRVTPDSVRVARYRLRKKLPIDAKEDLVSFMLAI
jgi:tetratricopeptide (TPR) repeat protein